MPKGEGGTPDQLGDNQINFSKEERSSTDGGCESFASIGFISRQKQGDKGP